MIWPTQEGSTGGTWAGLSRPKNFINPPDYLNNLNLQPNTNLFSKQFDPLPVKDISAKSYVINALNDLHHKYEHLTRLLDECNDLPQKIKKLENEYDSHQMFVFRLNNINIDAVRKSLDDISNTIRSVTMVASFIKSEKDEQQYNFDSQAQNDFFKYQLNIINDDVNLEDSSKENKIDFKNLFTPQKSYQEEMELKEAKEHKVKKERTEENINKQLEQKQEEINNEDDLLEQDNEYQKMIVSEIETAKKNDDSTNQECLNFVSATEDNNNQSSSKEFEEYETISAENKLDESENKYWSKYLQ